MKKFLKFPRDFLILWVVFSMELIHCYVRTIKRQRVGNNVKDCGGLINQLASVCQ